jgi:hypothetical protein
LEWLGTLARLPIVVEDPENPGTYHIAEGQHTIGGYLLHWPNGKDEYDQDIMIDVVLADYDEVAARAGSSLLEVICGWLFLKNNDSKTRRNTKAFDRVNVSREMGTPEAVTIFNILDCYGIQIVESVSRPPKSGETTIVDPWTRILAKWGATTLEDVVKIVTTVYANKGVIERTALTAGFIEGFAKYYANCGKSVDWLTRRLRSTHKNGWIAERIDVQRVEESLGSSSHNTLDAFAAVFSKAVDGTLSSRKRRRR